jgi:hypothetical protein
MILRSMFGRVAILALAVGLGVPLTANATFTLTLQSGNYYEEFTDTNGDGIISVHVGGFNGFDFQGDFATSNSQTGELPAVLTLTQASVRSNRGDMRNLTITLIDDDFSAPSMGPAVVTTRLGALDLRDNGSVTMTSFVDDDQVGRVRLTETGYGEDTEETQIGRSPYTLRSVTTIRLGAGGVLLSTGSTEVNSGVSPVPAPATAVMALAGVPVLGAFGWFRRRNRPQA